MGNDRPDLATARILVQLAPQSISTFGLLICLFALSVSICGPSQAACGGADLFGQLRAEDPERLATIQTAGRAMPFGNGRMFRLSREGTAPSILFGTLHLSDPRVVDFSARVNEAIRTARQVAVEFIQDPQSLRRPASARRDEGAWVAIQARDDQRPDRLLDVEDLELLKLALKDRGLPEGTAQNLNPAALVLLLDIPPCAATLPGGALYAEALIQDIAHKHHIPVVGLETLAGQLKAIDDLPRDVERELLVSSVLSSFRAEDVVETEVRRYAGSNIGELVAWMMSPQPIPGVPRSRIPPASLKRLLDDRNLLMRDKALPLLRQGAAFIAVGAAHLPGENGLVRLLQAEGYRVDVLE
jgi:uncharacterized protein